LETTEFSVTTGGSFFGDVPVDLKLSKELKCEGIGGISLKRGFSFFGE
jgi:hypothetical protein